MIILPHSRLITKFVARLTRIILRSFIFKYSECFGNDLYMYIYYTKRIFRVARCLVFSVVFCILLFVLSSFFFWPLYSSIYASDYPIGIFKLFLNNISCINYLCGVGDVSKHNKLISSIQQL